MKRPLLQLICIFALLAAQQGALTHAVWHVHEQLWERALHQDAEHDRCPDHDHSTQADLCSLHALLAAVLGVAGTPGMQFWFPPAAAEGPPQRLHPRISTDAVPYLSRGPPALT